MDTLSEEQESAVPLENPVRSLWSLSSPPNWPDPPKGVAWYGLAGDFVEVISPESEADPIGLLVQLLLSYGNVIGRGAHFLAEGDAHYTNQFALLVGESSKGRKGSSWGQIKRLYQSIDSQWIKSSIKTGLSSGEGIVWSVRDASGTPSVPSAGGKPTAQPGVTDKRLLAYAPEFASLLAVMRREGNTLCATIREAWDTGNLQILNKNSPTTATDAHISIVGHATRQELVTSFTPGLMSNGFANRFLWVCVRRSKMLPEGGRDLDTALAPLIARLNSAVAFGRQHIQVSRDAEAAELWGEVYPALSEGDAGNVGSILGRAEAHVMRLALLYALLDLSAKVKTIHLQAALALWNYCDESVRYVFAGDEDPRVEQLLEFIHSGGQRGRTRSEMRDYYSGHRKAADIARDLEVLAKRKLALCVPVPTEGRYRERWISTATDATKATEGVGRMLPPGIAPCDRCGEPLSDIEATWHSCWEGYESDHM